MHTLIEKNAELYANKTALTFYNVSLTYSDLNSQSNRLAHYLSSIKMGLECKICVLMPPCHYSVISLIAILKIGAIYVPLDIDSPPERLKLMIEDIQPSLIITYTDCTPNSIPIEYLHIDISSFFSSINLNYPESNLIIKTVSKQLAYIFYTSGTTGKPKGVVATRNNLEHYLNSAIQAFGIDSHTIIPTIARFTFSISLFEILSPLVTGGTVMILHRDHILDMPRLTSTLQNITMAHIGPSLLKRLINHIHSANIAYDHFSNIQHISSGGDTVRPTLMNTLNDIFQNADAFVIYGCSEISCMGCYFPILRPNTATTTLIGHPFKSVNVLIINSSGKPVQHSETGEIYISGPGVTHGYLNLPELTDEKYITYDQKFYYCTGDIGRWHPDGNIEILGRKDHQIQLHGIRVELGEIENQLNQLPGVKEAAASAVSIDSDEKALIAYLVFHLNPAPPLEYLKSTISQNLPKYMMPSIFVALDRLPLNHNLKLDRKSLPLPTHDNQIQCNIEFTEPANEVEKILLDILKSIFQNQKIGTHHDFFDLGGTSIQAIDYINQIEEYLGKNIPITVFFSNPKIIDLAKLILKNDSLDTQDLYILKQGKRNICIFFIHGALIYKELIDNLPSHQTSCVLYNADEMHSIAKQNTQSLMASYSDIKSIAHRYTQSILDYKPDGPYHIVGFSIGGLIAIEIAKILTAKGHTVYDMILIDTHVPDFLSRARFKKLFFHTQQLFKNGLPHFQYLFEKALNRFKIFSSLIHQNHSDTKFSDHHRMEELRRIARDHATSGYKPTRLEHDVTLIKAMDRAKYELNDNTLGWQPYFNKIRIFNIPGNHNEILKGASAVKISDIVMSHFNQNTQ